VYRFTREPRWILSHLFVALIVVACVVAGFWQLDRLDQRRDRNALLDARTEQPVAPIQEVLTPDASAEEADAVTYRRVAATGTYAVGDDVLVANRTNGGVPGYWVLTPLVVDEGWGVLVNRGWIPLSVGDDPAARAERAAPPTGRVTAVGLLAPTQERGSPGPIDEETGRIERLARVDVEAVEDQTRLELVADWLALEAQDPPVAGALPRPVEPAERGEGPHLSYAIQWFFFASLAVGGYALVLRRVARDKAREAAGAPRPPRGRSRHVPVDD
jgi:cytochrome oxidase assembly protein ShyY1